MKKLRLLLILGVFGLSACSHNNDKFSSSDQVQGQSAEQLFTHAEHSMTAGDYESATKYLESLDSQYPLNAHSEQMLLDLIYSYYRTGDKAAAGATASRYIHQPARGRKQALCFCL